MVFDSTYSNDEQKELINDLVGKHFSLLQSIKLGGIGSKRMIIGKVSLNLSTYINTIADINYGSIELRPFGIIVHFTKGLSRYSWAIPYYQLVIYKTEGISFHAQDKFIQFKNNKTYKENKKFFEKLFRLKLESSTKYSLV